jgi:hypothetical protein
VKLAALAETARHLLTKMGDPPVLGSLSERRSASARPMPARRTPRRRPAFNSARRDLPRAPAHSRALGSTGRGTSSRSGPVPEPFHRSCELRRPDSEQRPPGAILGAASFSAAFPRGSHFPCAGTACEQRAPTERTARLSLVRDRVFALWMRARGERSRDSVNSRPSFSGTVTRRSTVPRGWDR